MAQTVQKASEASQLRQLFENLDQDKSGELDHQEVAQLMVQMGKELNARELDECMSEMDPDGNGTLLLLLLLLILILSALS